jgi:Flp pilus assembly protein TadD
VDNASRQSNLKSSRSAQSTVMVCTLFFILVIKAGTTIYAARTGFDVASANNLAQAKASLDQGQYANAEKQLQKYLSDHPLDAEAKYLLAFVLFRENKPADSLKEYTEAARQRAPHAADLKTVALDYVLLNDYADANRWIRSSLSMDANDADAWYEAGRIEYTLNYFQPALDSFQRTLQLDPASVKAENNLGLAFEGLNRIDDAISAYRKAVAMQATSTHPSEQPLLNLATVLIDRNQLDEAQLLLQEAEQIAPHDWKILAQLGRLYLQKGDLSAARNVLEQAVAIEPQRGALHFQLGQVYKKSGEFEKAKAEFATTEKLMGTTSSTPPN